MASTYAERLEGLLRLMTGDGSWQPTLFGFRKVRKASGLSAKERLGKVVIPMMPSIRTLRRMQLAAERRAEKRERGPTLRRLGARSIPAKRAA
jgi:hypothetical protein